MINSKTIQIGGKVVKVSEVSVRKVLQVLPFLNAATGDTAKNAQDAQQEGTADAGFMANITAMLGDSCGLTVDDLLDLHASELEELWTAFREVNAFFFKVAFQLRLEEKLAEMIGTMLQGFGGLFAGLFSEVIANASSMDIPGLSPPSPTPSGSAATNE
jgi:hypothetical protein